MDGNGRWAQQRGLPRIEGHRNGVKRVNEIIDTAVEQQLEAVTFYTFSMENWQRPAAEVNALMRFLSKYLKNEMERLHALNIVFRAIGDIKRLPSGVRKLIDKFEKLTMENTGLIVTSALSYGGRTELVHAVQNIIKEGIPAEDINESVIGEHLYTIGIPEPDLIIRTSGEVRTSNFLIWQAAYAELYFTEILWPDFGRDEFIAALSEYENRDRRFGGLPGKGKK